MATISYVSQDGLVLDCSNSLLSGIAERALLNTRDLAFIGALKEIEWLGDIDLYLFSAKCRMIFAQAADALADDVEACSGEFPEYVSRTRHIALEVRNTVMKEGNL